MPSLRYAVDDQIASPRSGRSLRVPSARQRSNSDIDTKGSHIDAKGSHIETKGSHIETKGSPASARDHDRTHRERDRTQKKEKERERERDQQQDEQLSPRGSHVSPTARGSGKRREFVAHDAAALPHGPARTASEIPPAPPSASHLFRPPPQSESAPTSPASPAAFSHDVPLSPRSQKKAHKSHKSEHKTTSRIEKEARKTDEKAKKQEEKAEEKKVDDAERKTKKDDDDDVRSSKALGRQNSAPSLSLSTLIDLQYEHPVTFTPASPRNTNFATVALGRGAALTSAPATQAELIAASPSPSVKGDGRQKQGTVSVLKKALTIPNWRKRHLQYANGSLNIHKKEVRVSVCVCVL